MDIQTPVMVFAPSYWSYTFFIRDLGLSIKDFVYVKREEQIHGRWKNVGLLLDGYEHNPEYTVGLLVLAGRRLDMHFLHEATYWEEL
jgi:hypothetical protein